MGTKRLHPEIKALRALVRALEPLDMKTQVRAVDWLHGRIHDAAHKAARLAEAD